MLCTCTRVCVFGVCGEGLKCILRRVFTTKIRYEGSSDNSHNTGICYYIECMISRTWLIRFCVLAIVRLCVLFVYESETGNS